MASALKEGQQQNLWCAPNHQGWSNPISAINAPTWRKATMRGKSRSWRWSHQWRTKQSRTFAWEYHRIQDWMWWGNGWCQRQPRDCWAQIDWYPWCWHLRWGWRGWYEGLQFPQKPPLLRRYLRLGEFEVVEMGLISVDAFEVVQLHQLMEVVQVLLSLRGGGAQRQERWVESLPFWAVAAWRALLASKPIQCV